MFADTFSFVGGGQSSKDDPFTFPASQENYFSQPNFGEEGQAAKGVRELDPGCLPCTVAFCKRSHIQCDSFASGKCHMLNRNWQFVILVGMLSEVEDLEGDIWSGMIDDGTERIPFRYEIRTDFSDKYKDDLVKVREPLDEADMESFQLPVKMFGQPQIINDQLCFMASFLKVAEPMEYAATIPLEAAAAYLELQSVKDEKAGVVGRATGEVPIVPSEVSGDPYNDDEIVIKDADISDIIGADRLKRVIWKYLRDEYEKRSDLIGDNHSVLAAAVRGFCSKKWKNEAVDNALEDLEDGGIVMFMDDSRTRVSLVVE